MLSLADFERFAAEKLTKDNWKGISGGAEEEVTLKDNVKAFKRYKIIPSLLRDVTNLDTSCTVLGYTIPFPVCISPTAAHGRAHPSGEVGTAKGAADAGTIFTMATYSSRTIEDVANDSPPGSIRFMQIYFLRKRDLVLQILRKAESTGYKALVVTVDSPTTTLYVGKNLELTRENFARQAPMCYANLLTENEANLTYAQKFDYCEKLLDNNVTWNDIKWLQSNTKLPIILKGILNADDAVQAVDIGAAGILVSNHGGRQLDTVPATIDVLEEIVRAVRGRCEVYLDGGVRTGTDVLKALALGAQAVFIGRPAIYALAYKGSDGVKEMLDLLKADFAAAMAMAGCANVKQTRSCIIRHKNTFAKI